MDQESRGDSTFRLGAHALPRAWTDARLVARAHKIEADTQLARASLPDLVDLVAALKDRV